MTYAVMQTELEPPTAEQLKNAFQKVPGLTAMDGNVLGRDAYGVVVTGFERERASAMQSALAAQGVETEMVEDSVLTAPPAPRELGKVEFTPEALQIEDCMGKSFSLEWGEIWIIAAGRARLTDFTNELVNKVVTQAGRDYTPVLVTASVTKEEQKEHLLLEVITHGAAVRYHAKADLPGAQLLFQSLGQRRTKNPGANLTLFVQELAKFAPAAFLNHGACQMRDGENRAFVYPSKTAFYREITWLMWMTTTGRMRKEMGSSAWLGNE